MSGPDDELADYVDRSQRTRPGAPAKKPSGGKRLALVAAGAVVLWAGIAAITDSNPGHQAPGPANPSSNNPATLGASSPSGSAEYIIADQPTAPAYRASDGVRYNSTPGAFGPADATITRNHPGDYTVDIPDIDLAGGAVQVSSYASPAACYTQDSHNVGTDAVVRVVCLSIGTSAPSNHIGPLAGGGTDSPFTVAITGQASHPTTKPQPPQTPAHTAAQAHRNR